MNRLLLAVVCALALTVPLSAQKPRTLVDHQTELGLSDEQVGVINKTLELFQAELKAYRDRLVANEKELALLLQQRAEVDRIKTVLRTSADLGFQMQYLDVVTARKVEAALTPEQLKKWHEIQRRLPKETQK